MLLLLLLPIEQVLVLRLLLGVLKLGLASEAIVIRLNLAVVNSSGECFLLGLF